MPIIIKARGDDHTGDLIKKFKKIIAATDIIQIVKDRAQIEMRSFKTQIQVPLHRQLWMRKLAFGFFLLLGHWDSLKARKWRLI